MLHQEHLVPVSRWIQKKKMRKAVKIITSISCTMVAYKVRDSHEAVLYAIQTFKKYLNTICYLERKQKANVFRLFTKFHTWATIFCFCKAIRWVPHRPHSSNLFDYMWSHH